MKPLVTFLISISMVFAGAFSGNAGLSEWFYGESWSFVESVGGIAIGELSKNQQDEVYLNVLCDVSGLTAITKPPTTMNSALVVKRINKKINGNELYLSISTGLATKENTTSKCTGVNLGHISQGDYRVFYSGSEREKHLLGKINVK